MPESDEDPRSPTTVRIRASVLKTAASRSHRGEHGPARHRGRSTEGVADRSTATKKNPRAWRTRRQSRYRDQGPQTRTKEALTYAQPYRQRICRCPDHPKAEAPGGQTEVTFILTSRLRGRLGPDRLPVGPRAR